MKILLDILLCLMTPIFLIIVISIYIIYESSRKVTIKKEITEIPNNEFENENVTDIIFEDSKIRRIGAYAFKNCKNLRNFTCIEHLDLTEDEYYRKYFFEGLFKDDDEIIDPNTEKCYNCLPKPVKEIEEEAFVNCKSIEEINLPSSITVIGESAFLGCRKLKKCSLPENINILSDYLFAGCKSLEKIYIPDLVSTICSYAFKDCKSLIKISIPREITEINEYVFVNCKKLSLVKYRGTKEDWKKVTIYDTSFDRNITIQCKDGDIII